MNIFLNISDDSLKEEITSSLSSHTICNVELDSQIVISDSPMSTRVKQVYISKDSDLDNLKILQEYEIDHLIGHTDHFLDELKHILNFIETKSLPTLKSFLEEKSNIKETDVIHSKEVNPQIEEILNDIDFEGFFETPKNHIRLILNELITNAFYHQEGLENRERSTSIFSLTPIKTSIGIDQKRVAVSVKDNIGIIRIQDLIASILRGHIEKKPLEGNEGAGLGLYMVYENINQLHIIQNENNSTEFICIIDANKRYKKFKERITSFHFYRGCNE